MKTETITGLILGLLVVGMLTMGVTIPSTMELGVVRSNAAVLMVPDDYGTIQEAIDAASYGDIVRVSAGTYTESIIMKDGVSVIGAGKDVTTIQWNGRVVYGASDATIRGFKITGNLKGNVGIHANGVSKFRIIDNEITDFNGTYHSSARGIIITNSKLVNICINEISDIIDDKWGDSRGIDVVNSNSTLIYGNRIFDIVDEEWSSVFGIRAINFNESTIVGNLIFNNCFTSVHILCSHKGSFRLGQLCDKPPLTRHQLVFQSH